MVSRASDQWFKREDVVLEAAEVSIGLVTVANAVTIASLPTVNVNSMPVVTTSLQGHSFKYFANANTSLATTFAVKGSSAVLHTITVGGASNPTIGVFNHATAATNPVLVVLPGTPQKNFVLDETLANGLVVEYGEGETAPLNISYT